MAEQLSGAENAGQAIYDALGKEAKAAVDLLPSLDIDPYLLRLFGNAVAVAHESNPRGWSLIADKTTGGRQFLRLTCNEMIVVSLEKQDLQLAVKTSPVLSEVLERQSDSPTKSPDSQYEEIIHLRMARTYALHLPDEVVVAGHDAIRWLGEKGWATSAHHYLHRDDWRVCLARLIGRALPAPDYLDSARYGLSPFRPDNPSTTEAGLSLRHRFAAKGLTYTALQIASFYTALQTKGFVILSGISGTGKSKIAQRFTELLPDSVVHSSTTLKDSGDPVQLRLRPYMQKYNRFAIPMKFQEQIPVPEPGQSWDVPIIINGQSGISRVHTSDGTNSNNTWIFLKGDSVEHFRTIDGERFSIDFIPDEEQGLRRIVLHSVDPAINRPQIDVSDGSNIITFQRPLENSMTKYRTFVVPREKLVGVKTPAIGTSLVVDADVNKTQGQARFENVKNVDTGQSRVVRVTFRGVAADTFAKLDVRQFSVQLILEDDRSVRKIVVRSSDVADDKSIGSNKARTFPNHLFLPVRPDWRDGKQLIGYHNPLTGEYVRTPFLEFVLAAADDYHAGNRNAFFVILDEMNLAHVEYYFADMLSVIESGRDDEGWTVEGVPLAVGEEDADLPETLKLPPNLYIVGTVNMDETTHPFSPKVLDRAFTIELTDVDFENYPPQPTEAVEIADEEKQALLEAFTQSGRYARIDMNDIRQVVDTYPTFGNDLQRLNTSLKRHRMHFGYRVFDEIMQFVHNAERNELFNDVADAFDHAVLMKVLPKFNGSRGKLQNALFELLHWCRTPALLTSQDRSDYEARFTQFQQDGQAFDTLVSTGDQDTDSWRYPATGRRVALMMQDLYTEGFASFG